MGRLSTAAREERGVTVIELLVVMIILGVVMAVASGAVFTALQSQRRQIARAEALNSAKTAMERMTREIRGANPLVAGTDSRIEVLVVREADDEERRTVYEVQGAVAGFSCPCLVLTEERTTISTGATTTSTRVAIEELDYDAGETLFRYRDSEGAVIPASASDPPLVVGYVRSVDIRVRLGLPEGDDTVFLSDQVALRNEA